MPSLSGVEQLGVQLLMLWISEQLIERGHRLVGAPLKIQRHGVPVLRFYGRRELVGAFEVLSCRRVVPILVGGFSFCQGGSSRFGVSGGWRGALFCDGARLRLARSVPCRARWGWRCGCRTLTSGRRRWLLRWICCRGLRC